MTKQKNTREYAQEIFQSLDRLPIPLKYYVIDELAHLGRREILANHRKEMAR